MKPTLVVLAAGMGSRYGGIKQIDSMGLNGEAIIDFSIYDAIRAGFGKVVFIVRKEIERDVRNFFRGKFEDKVAVSYVLQDISDVPVGFQVPRERSKPWGTCHAVLAARNIVHEPFAVINGDDFYGYEAYILMAEYLQDIALDSTDYAMVGYPMSSTLSQNGSVSRGVTTCDQGGWLQSFVEHKKLVPHNGAVVSYDDDNNTIASFSGTETVSMNFFGFTPRVMHQFLDAFQYFLSQNDSSISSEIYIPYAMTYIMEKKTARMKVLPCDAQWFGITYAEDKPAVVKRIRALIDAGDYPSRLWG